MAKFPQTLSSAQPTRRSFLAGASALATAGAIGRPNAASAATPMKFSLDYRVYGSTAPFVYGQDLGLYDKAGISAQIDGSLGSADTVTRIASGEYDFGCADVATLAVFAARNPGVAPMLVMPIYDRNAACIISFKDKPVNSFKDLEGKKLGISTSDAGSRLLALLLKQHNVDAAKIQLVTIEQKLRDTLLLQRRVDAVIGFDYTTLFDLIANGVPEQDVVFVYYADNGFNFYGQGLLASRKQIQQNPALVKSVADIVAKSWVAAAQDPAAAMVSVVKRVPLTDATVETARLKWVLDRLVVTPNVRANGLGAMDISRLDQGLGMIKEGFGIAPNSLNSADIWNGNFIPPIADRKIA